MKNVGTWTGTSEAGLTNRIQEMEERVSGIGLGGGGSPNMQVLEALSPQEPWAHSDCANSILPWNEFEVCGEKCPFASKVSTKTGSDHRWTLNVHIQESSLIQEPRSSSLRPSMWNPSATTCMALNLTWLGWRRTKMEPHTGKLGSGGLCTLLNPKEQPKTQC